jgi:beta-glucanase (GH16 family)
MEDVMKLRTCMLPLALLASACAATLDGEPPLHVDTSSLTARPATLKTALKGLFVTAENGGGGVVNANRPVASTWETFQLQDINGGALTSGDLVHLQALDGQFLCAENGGGGAVHANRAVASTWETFRVIKVTGGDNVVRDGDQIALRTFISGNYVSALQGGGDTVVADRTAVQSWETFVIGGSAAVGGGGGGGPPPPPNWVLTWSDEFNGAWGPVDGSKWNFDTGNSGFGNNELEYYTNRTDNAFVDGNGNLQIVARRENFGGSNYTSARINTGGKFSQAYGRFEARIKLPSGKGIWPAFWTLGENIGSAGWPQCGELDIMEAVGDFSVNHGSCHGPGYSGGNPLTATFQDPSGSLADGFHVYALEWQPNQVQFFVDGSLYETRTPADIPGKQWVYDHPFFVILNVAVGGNWPGAPDGTTQFPQTMMVDYVRVYTKK